MNSRENYLRAVEFRYPKWIPCRVGLMPATWKKYREELEEVVLRHPLIFGPYEKGSTDFNSSPPGYRQGEYFTDSWGCVWYNTFDGLEGQVVKHPLENWEALRAYQPPDPLVTADRGPQEDWEVVRKRLQETRQRGELAAGGLPHGFMFMRLYYLRGFENLMIDFVEEPPELHALIKMVLDHNMRLTNKWLELGVEVMHFGDDLGSQRQVMMGPEYFRKYIKPCYARMFGACRKAGAHVYLHSDGHILEIIDDLIDCGVTILNPQLGANGLNGLVEKCKGKVCVDLDLSRQDFPFCPPGEIKEHVREAVAKLGSREGGLMLYAECEPDVPLENIEAICEAFEECCFHLLEGRPAGRPYGHQ